MNSDLNKTIPDLVRMSSKTFKDQVAFITCMPNGMNGALTYGQVDQLSDRLACYLKESCGVKAGDRVALQMPNCLAFPIAAFGILKAGAILVNTNPLYTSREMIHQFNDAGVSVLIGIDIFSDKIPEVLKETQVSKVILTRIDEFFNPVVGSVIRLVQKYWNKQLPYINFPFVHFSEALKTEADPVKLKSYLSTTTEASVAALQYTGGTTGVSKGAMLTHRNILVNVDQVLINCGKAISPGAEIILTVLPLYHIFAFTLNLVGFYKSGGKNILIPNPRPLSNLKRAFENYKITWVSGVNTLFNGLCSETWFCDAPPRHLKATAAGGTALQSAVATKWEEVTRSLIIEGYGLTEASPALAFNPLEGRIKKDSIGVPVPWTEIKCVNENGEEVKIGEPGELIAKGPQVMKGYWNKPKETAETIKNDWLYTGDIAIKDSDGYFKIVDRKKDMILVSGFNVFPNEVEDILAKIPQVSECAVIGVQDGAQGEAVKAFIVRKDESLTELQVKEFCKKELTPYKVPKLIEFRTDLPKSPVGKILRKDLRS